MTVINFPGSGGRNGGESPIVRAVALKQRLVGFVLAGPLRAELDRINHGVSLDPPFTAAAVDLIDWFLFEWEGPDGAQALDEFLEQSSDLSDEDRGLVEGWYEAIDDIFEVVGRRGAGFVLADEEGVEYVVVPTMMRAEELDWEPGTHVSTRILPVGGVYILSGVQSVGETREELEDAALDRLDAQIDEMMRVIWGVMAAAFSEFFGSDEADVPARELAQRLEEFRRFALEEYRLEGVGRTLGDVLRETFGQVPPLDLMKEREADLAGMGPDVEATLLADPEEGVAVAPGFPPLRRFVSRGEGDAEALRDTVLDLLESDSVPPFVFRRLAALGERRLGELLAHALDDPDFDMAADFEDLLEEYKPEFDDEDDAESWDDPEDWPGGFDALDGDGLVTPDDLDDVRDLPDEECPAGSLAEAARAYLAEAERGSKPAAFQRRLEGVNLLMWFADDEGIDLVEHLTGEALRRFAGVWYTRAWSERGAEDAKDMLATLEKFGAWLARARGWERGDEFLRTALPRLKRDLPRTVEASERLAEAVEAEEWPDGADGGDAEPGETLEGMFVIRQLDGHAVAAELSAPADGGGGGGAAVRLDVPAPVASLLRAGDYFSGAVTRYGDRWELTFHGGFFPAAAVE